MILEEGLLLSGKKEVWFNKHIQVTETALMQRT